MAGTAVLDPAASRMHSAQVPGMSLGMLPPSSSSTSGPNPSGHQLQTSAPALALGQQAQVQAHDNALLNKLFASLQVVRGAKAAAGCAPSEGACAPAGTQRARSDSDLLDEMTSELSLLDLSSSPTGPLSRQESLTSLSSSFGSQVPLHLGTSGHFYGGAHRAAPALIMAPQTTSRATAFPQPQQLVTHLPPRATHNTVLPTPQAFPAPAPSNCFPTMMPGGLSPALVVQQLQQQLLLQHMVSQQAACQQQEVQECLVGPYGQYQPYCNQLITEELNSIAQCLLTQLKALQQGDPALGIWAKRYFCSIKEVSKVVHRAKCLIVAPDVKPNPAAHINPVRMLLQVLRDADMCGVPVVFALSRRGIGQVFGRDKSMSIVAVMSSDMCHAEFAALLMLAQQGRAQHELQRQGLHMAM